MLCENIIIWDCRIVDNIIKTSEGIRYELIEYNMWLIPLRCEML